MCLEIPMEAIRDTYYVKGGGPFAAVKRRIFVDEFSKRRCFLRFVWEA